MQQASGNTDDVSSQWAFAWLSIDKNQKYSYREMGIDCQFGSLFGFLTERPTDENFINC